MNLLSGFVRFLPQRFDGNEWFLCGVVCLLAVALCFIQKYLVKLNVVELIFVFVLNSFIGVLIDDLISMPPFDWYDTGDRPFPALNDVLLHWFIYPAWMYIVLCVYRMLQPRHGWIAGYVALSALVTTILDLVSVCFRVITYKTWVPIYSFWFYFLIIAINIICLGKLRSLRTWPKGSRS